MYLISMKQGGASIPLIPPPEMTRGIGAWVVALCKMGLRENTMADFWAKQRSKKNHEKSSCEKVFDILSCRSIISVPCRAYHPGKWPSPIDTSCDRNRVAIFNGKIWHPLLDISHVCLKYTLQPSFFIYYACVLEDSDSWRASVLPPTSPGNQ